MWIIGVMLLVLLFIGWGLVLRIAMRKPNITNGGDTPDLGGGYGGGAWGGDWGGHGGDHGGGHH